VDDGAVEPAAVMVLACWTERDGRVLVRLRRTLDVRTGTVVTSYAASRTEVIEQVAGWLDEVGARR
jgi:hypothetical protein